MTLESVSLLYEMRYLKLSRISARYETVEVFVDDESRESVEIPKLFRDKLEAVFAA